ncbi:MAG: LAGLIDADG family homing endonuclease [Candidatus Hodarchaeaceae archaeon]|nr:LAGLIDADG family homing endonuclease [Candidatus Hodarchaeaceae archaeon]
MFAAEGSVIIRKSGILHHLNISSKDEKLIEFLKMCLELLGMTSSEYDSKGKNLPIHGWRNFKRFKELGIHTLHPEKRAKFEQGFASYKRVNVLSGEEARALILQQLASGPKTYDDLAAALGKARTTIQAHHIPILEREGKVRRVGKRGQAWLWALVEPGARGATEIILAVEPVVQTS